MRVIFIKDVPKLGKIDDVKDINDGYVQNFLLPRQLVQIATPQSLSKLEKKLTDRKAGKDKDSLHSKLLIDSLNNQEVTIKAKANEKGSLFKSITAKDIAIAVKNELKISDTEGIFEENLHIKALGEEVLPIASLGYKGNLKINIVKE